jgi:RNA recognition motif-containing protein
MPREDSPERERDERADRSDRADRDDRNGSDRGVERERGEADKSDERGRAERKRYGETSAASLLVRNVSYRVSPEEIRRLMEKYGEVRDVYIPLDHSTGRPRGFAFVEFFDGRDARSIIYLTILS